MTYKQVQKKLDKLADEIDEVLSDLEAKGKENTKNYEALFYLGGGLHDLADMGFND